MEEKGKTEIDIWVIKDQLLYHSCLTPGNPKGNRP